MLTVLLMSIVFIGVAMLFLGLGLMMTGKCIRGTCGGEMVAEADGEHVRCGSCGREKKQ